MSSIPPLATQTLQPRSFCVVCDAAEGECQHNGHRYLEDIVYVKTDEGYVVPEHERARWDMAPLRIGDPPKKTVEEARDVDECVTALQDAFYLDPPLEQRFRSVHGIEPLKASRLTTVIVEGAQTGSLRNPAGLLWKRLAELEQ